MGTSEQNPITYNFCDLTLANCKRFLSYKTGRYIVRPIYNLSGMGVGAEFKTIQAGDFTSVPPGFFWCEVFDGVQFSADYEFVHGVKPYWQPLSCFYAETDGHDIYRFRRWVRSDYVPEVPRIFNELSDVRRINIEFIGDRPIEVHLRTTPDPDYDEIIPVWGDQSIDLAKYERMGYSYLENYDNADGFLSVPRLGFLVRNHKSGE